MLTRDFVLPFYGGESRFETNQAVFQANGCDFHMHERTTEHRIAEYSDGLGNAQEVELFRRFSALVLSKKLEPIWGEIALKTQQVMDAVFASSKNGSTLFEVA